MTSETKTIALTENSFRTLDIIRGSLQGRAFILRNGQWSSFLCSEFQLPRIDRSLVNSFTNRNQEKAASDFYHTFGVSVCLDFAGRYHRGLFQAAGDINETHDHISRGNVQSRRDGQYLR